MTTWREVLKRMFPPKTPLTQSQAAEAEREERVASREPIDYSYTVYWTKTARLWHVDQRATIAGNLAALLGSPDFQANPFNRKYTLQGLEGAHSGASLIALQKVLLASILFR
ncbi:MAG TPA: hypothetical protein VII92_11135 [Anaerolineae bacterium]